MAQNPLTFRSYDEIEKPAGQVLSRALGHDSRGVTQGQMQRSLDELVLDLRRLGDGPGDDRGFGIAGPEKLGCLLDTFGEYELRLELVPEAGLLQHLLGSLAIGRMGRIGDGDTPHAWIQQVRQLRRLDTASMIDGERYASQGVYLLRTGDDFPVIAQALNEALVRGKEDVDGSALLYLGGQTAAGSKDYSHLGAGLSLEGGGDVLESEPQTAGGGHDQLIPAGRIGLLAARRYDGEPNQANRGQEQPGGRSAQDPPASTRWLASWSRYCCNQTIVPSVVVSRSCLTNRAKLSLEYRSNPNLWATSRSRLTAS